jgi:hypothetical protein
LDFNIPSSRLHRNKKDGCVYGNPRKQYTRTKPPTSGWRKIKNNPRENVSIIKLTRLGYTTNQIATVLGRSFSYIHNRVRTAITRGILHFIDKRKLPSATRLRTSSIRMKNLYKWMKLWEAFILGETERPP